MHQHFYSSNARSHWLRAFSSHELITAEWSGALAEERENERKRWRERDREREREKEKERERESVCVYVYVWQREETKIAGYTGRETAAAAASINLSHHGTPGGLFSRSRAPSRLSRSLSLRTHYFLVRTYYDRCLMLR